MSSRPGNKSTALIFGGVLTLLVLSFIYKSGRSQSGLQPVSDANGTPPVSRNTSSFTPPVAGWMKMTMPKPLGIEFYVPTEYEVFPNSTKEGTWGVTINSDTNMKIDLCVGCQTIKGSEICGMQANKCELGKEYKLPREGGYSLMVFKTSGEFAVITGGLYKENGEDIPLSVTTTDKSMPSEQDLDNLQKILTSVTSR